MKLSEHIKYLQRIQSAFNYDEDVDIEILLDSPDYHMKLCSFIHKKAEFYSEINDLGRIFDEKEQVFKRKIEILLKEANY